ncbi:NAD(P)-binding domain protein [Akanthomyces lecanii RCEF 1005]|uniref:NAD(P)-binding domain protein n=1 Tax=Akanthomyces lecanii RCEF 1005 TaxID=1081108 RepID=A0A168JK50_CORDF|nr:NAD(P)-binding domain protein [Akanthomyces lecanii RCEF 1005]
MATYLVTGVSRGLGFEFLRQLSAEPNNLVVGLVRDQAATLAKVEAELASPSNVHILQADIADYASLKSSVDKIADITGSKIDYIIANAALVSRWSAYKDIGSLDPDGLDNDLRRSFDINVIGNIHLFNLFMPFVLNGRVKKVVALSTGMADLDLVNDYSIQVGAPYSISKAALNLAVAKFNARYKREGVLFLSISPGFVETGQDQDATEEEKRETAAMGAAFAKYAPHFTGPDTPEASVKNVLRVISTASVETGHGGAFISHLGNKQWL